MKHAPSTVWSHWLQRLGWAQRPMLVADDPASLGTAFGLEMSLLPDTGCGFDELSHRAAGAPHTASLFKRRHS
jgi:hypothetical protein